MKASASVPQFCIETSPTYKSVLFASKYINLHEIARQLNMDTSYLSRIMAGRRAPTVQCARNIARILGMAIEPFLDALDKRAEMVEAADKKVIIKHFNRIAAEDKADLDKIKRGGIPAPRLPGLRAS